MLNKYKTAIAELDNALNSMSIEIDDPIKLSEEAIEHISNTLSDIKTQVIEASFQSIDDEIDFFKNTKPKILSKLFITARFIKLKPKNPMVERKLYENTSTTNSLNLKHFSTTI